MKTTTALFVAVFFILAVIKTSKADYVTISGKVRYADNGQVVSSGVVKAFNEFGQFETQVNINTEGDYILGVIRALHKDLIGFPNIEPEADYVPTGYPSAIDPLLMVHVDAMQNHTGIDIYVQRVGGGGNAPFTPMTNVSGLVLSDNQPIKDVVVYAKSGNEYIGFGVSNSKGEFRINNIPEGDYILIAHKVMQNSASKPVTLGEGGLDNVILNVSPKKDLIVSTNPVSFMLSQNFPNPFNPATVISYSVPKDGKVTLNVYNTLGEQVAELVNGNQNVGSYEVNFNASGFSSGVYYYRLESNGFVDTKKMILVK
ncbi:MAG: T9SS type A sorting domain-containing protein [Chlorobi bacterium]|nr:T9SS type A sorting domain-containing protein [Chlorobiota bacterium]